MVNKIDSNVAGLSYAEESELKVLPGVSGADAVWYPLEPNEFDDMGGEITTVARTPINASRQRKKGVVTDLDASGGFTSDLTQNNLLRLMQGFFFANAHERISRLPINGTDGSTAGVVDFEATADVINVAAGKGALYTVGMILKSSGMANEANNIDRMVITGIATDAITVDAALTDETVSGTTANLEIVGYQFSSGEGQISYNGTTGVLQLTKKTGVLPTTLGFQVGEWIFIGGDSDNSKFATNSPGFARIEAISTTALTLKEATWTPVTEVGAAPKTIEIYFGRFLRNEDSSSLIRQRSYQIERTLGQDANGVQSEYLVGAIPNEFNMTIPSADKITCDLSFVAMDNELRTGAEGVKAGTRPELVIEDAFNTSSDIYQLRLFVNDPLVNTPNSLFAYVREANISINNNVSGLKAIGVLGSFDSNIGDFEVGGDMEIYFTTVEAIRAVKNNADVAFNIIGSKDNAGFVYDIPLLSLGGGRAEIEKDEPIMLPVETSGAANTFGYTLSATYFSYLPDIAMATQ